MIGLLVLLALLATAYLFMDNYQKGQRAQLQKKVDEENTLMIEEYNQKVMAQQALMTKPDSLVLPDAKQEGWDIVDASQFPVQSGQTVTTSREDALTGGLMLLNRWHELPGDFSAVEGMLKSVGAETKFKVPVKDRAVSLFPAAIQALERFVADAKEEMGLENYIIRTGYRSMETQTGYWNKELAKYPDRTGDALIEAARKNVSYPGTSDYQSGFSFEMDVYSRDDSVINAADFQTTEQARFINENGWKYGFIFRYPTRRYPYPETQDKSYVTGMRTGLHMDAYRFVGVPHATVMHIKGFCLEEYIDFLVAHPHIIVYENGTPRYEIYRIPETGVNQSHDIPANASDFFVSTDNMGGLVCAITY